MMAEYRVGEQGATVFTEDGRPLATLKAGYVIIEGRLTVPGSKADQYRQTARKRRQYADKAVQPEQYEDKARSCLPTRIVQESLRTWARRSRAPRRPRPASWPTP